MFKKLRRITTLLLALCCLATAPALPAQATGQVLTSDEPAPTMQGAAGYVLEANTGTTLYAYNADERLYPASITKIMTALVAIENTEDLSDTLTFSNAAVNGISWDSSRIGAMVGEQMTVEQALYGLMLKSGNDAAVALAEYVSDSEEEFCELMNARAAELGCTDTHFVNSHGLHDPDHYTTAHDMALIMQEATKNEIFHTIDSAVTYQVPPTNKHADGFYWTMSNKMMNPNSQYYYDGVICGKTGFTDQAGNTLVTCAQRGDAYLVCVVMRCQQTHYADTKLLFDYGFNNFTVYDTNDVTNGLSYNMEGTGFFGDLEPIIGGSSFSVVSQSKYMILPNSVQASDLTTEVVYDETGVSGEDKTFATLRYLYNGTVVGETRLELRPETEEGFDFEVHENPIPETETQIVPEENKALVLDPIAIALGLLAAVIAIVATVLVLHYFSAANRRARRARKKRQELLERRTAASGRRTKSRLSDERRRRIQEED